MQGIIYRKPVPTAVLVLGLGAGTVVTTVKEENVLRDLYLYTQPNFVRQNGIPVDVVEIDKDVVQLASSDFGFQLTTITRKVSLYFLLLATLKAMGHMGTPLLMMLILSYSADSLTTSTLLV